MKSEGSLKVREREREAALVSKFLCFYGKIFHFVVYLTYIIYIFATSFFDTPLVAVIHSRERERERRQVVYISCFRCR